MKCISLRLGITLLTFMVGVGAAWIYPRIAHPASTALERAPVSKTSVPSTLSSSDSDSEAVKITLARSYRDEDGVIYAEFEVVNASGEPLYYRGV